MTTDGSLKKQGGRQVINDTAVLQRPVLHRIKKTKLLWHWYISRHNLISKDKVVARHSRRKKNIRKEQKYVSVKVWTPLFVDRWPPRLISGHWSDGEGWWLKWPLVHHNERIGQWRDGYHDWDAYITSLTRSALRDIKREIRPRTIELDTTINVQVRLV